MQASVIVVPKACAGSVVESTSHVLTAAHCIPEGTTDLPVKLKDGREMTGKLEFLDEVRDLAFLHLDQPAAAEPLKSPWTRRSRAIGCSRSAASDRARKAQKARAKGARPLPVTPRGGRRGLHHHQREARRLGGSSSSTAP